MLQESRLSKGNIVQVFTIDFSEIHFDRESQLVIGWTMQMNLQKKTIHTNSLQRIEEDTKDNGISLETCYSTSIEKSFPTRHVHPIIVAEPSFWNCGNGLHLTRLSMSYHQHRFEISGNFGDYLIGTVRLKTAITRACAHAYQTTCLTAHVSAVPHPSLRPTTAQSQISISSQCLFHNT